MNSIEIRFNSDYAFLKEYKIKITNYRCSKGKFKIEICY